MLTKQIPVRSGKAVFQLVNNEAHLGTLPENWEPLMEILIQFGSIEVTLRLSACHGF